MLVSHRADTQETDVENLSTIWHPTRDFLAVSNYKSNDGGDVGFFTKQGGKSFFKSKKKAAARPVVIAWHNREPILAIGWDNGKLTIVDPVKGHEDDIPLGAEIEEICGMHWNSESGTLLVADLKSHLSIYRIDTKEFSKSKFLHKATIRDEIPQALAVKAVKLKPSSANFATRKLAKQEAFNEGDEMLLNALAETKRRTNLTSADEKIYVKDNTETFPVYFIGCSKGGIYSLDEEGNFTKAFQCDNGVLQILNIPESDLLVVSTDSMLFYQPTVENRRATEVNRVKLTGKKNHFNLLLIENSTVAMCYGEREIRIWDLKGGDNALFRLNSEKGYDNKDDIVCLSYSAKKNMISAGTSQGKIARWKRRRDLKNQGLDQQWKLQNSVETDCHIISLNWSSTTAALVVNSINSVTIFRDEGIHVVFDQTYAAIQKSSTVISLIRLIHPLEAQDISLPFSVKGFRLSGKFITVWDEENVHIYEIKDSNDAPISITSSANFTCSAKDATIFGSMVIVLESNKLDIRTFQGTIRQTLGFREIEGLPILMDFNGKYMAVATTNGYLSVYDLSGKDIKQQFHSSQFSKTVPEFDKFLMIRVNSAGNRISFTATQKNDEIFERLSIWDGETDSVGYFSFQYGLHGNIEEAVNYFSKAHAYGSAIKLAKEHDMIDKLANLALQAGGSDLLEAAKFYEERDGHTDKAVMLYHKAGMIGRALDLAFRTEQHSALDLIVQELNEKSDPRILERAAQFFAANQQDRKAIQLLAYAGKYSEAINLCRERNVVVNEELAELLTPPKGDKAMAQSRNQMLEEVAKCCLHQGNYHFAAKKFTQAGNKIEAMRALLKSGDTPKIILFTNTARNKDIYRMAGNYLQTLSWHDDMDLMRSIESFYVKADALDSLSAFYKACADVEIDEYKDYDKGLNAYVEALNTINKKIAKDGGTDPRALNMQEELKEHIEKIQRFIKAKSLYTSDPGECLRVVSALIEEPGIEDAVRRGDLYTILILHNAKRSNFKKAYQYIEECLGRKPRIDIRQYINAQILDEICDKTEHPRITIQKATADDSDNEVGVEFSHAMRRRMNSTDNQSDDDAF